MSKPAPVGGTPAPQKRESYEIKEATGELKAHKFEKVSESEHALHKKVPDQNLKNPGGGLPKISIPWQKGWEGLLELISFIVSGLFPTPPSPPLPAKSTTIKEKYQLAVIEEKQASDECADITHQINNLKTSNVGIEKKIEQLEWELVGNREKRRDEISAERQKGLDSLRKLQETEQSIVEMIEHVNSDIERKGYGTAEDKADLQELSEDLKATQTDIIELKKVVDDRYREEEGSLKEIEVAYQAKISDQNNEKAENNKEIRQLSAKLQEANEKLRLAKIKKESLETELTQQISLEQVDYRPRPSLPSIAEKRKDWEKVKHQKTDQISKMNSFLKILEREHNLQATLLPTPYSEKDQVWLDNLNSLKVEVAEEIVDVMVDREGPKELRAALDSLAKLPVQKDPSPLFKFDAKLDRKIEHLEYALKATETPSLKTAIESQIKALQMLKKEMSERIFTEQANSLKQSIEADSKEVYKKDLDAIAKKIGIAPMQESETFGEAIERMRQELGHLLEIAEAKEANAKKRIEESDSRIQNLEKGIQIAATKIQLLKEEKMARRLDAARLATSEKKLQEAIQLIETKYAEKTLMLEQQQQRFQELIDKEKSNRNTEILDLRRLEDKKTELIGLIATLNIKASDALNDGLNNKEQLIPLIRLFLYQKAFEAYQKHQPKEADRELAFIEKYIVEHKNSFIGPLKEFVQGLFGVTTQTFEKQLEESIINVAAYVFYRSS